MLKRQRLTQLSFEPTIHSSMLCGKTHLSFRWGRRHLVHLNSAPDVSSASPVGRFSSSTSESGEVLSEYCSPSRFPIRLARMLMDKPFMSWINFFPASLIYDPTPTQASARSTPGPGTDASSLLASFDRPIKLAPCFPELGQLYQGMAPEAPCTPCGDFPPSGTPHLPRAHCFGHNQGLNHRTVALRWVAAACSTTHVSSSSPYCVVSLQVPLSCSLGAPQ